MLLSKSRKEERVDQRNLVLMENVQKGVKFASQKPMNDPVKINDDIQNFIESKQNSSAIASNPVGLTNHSSDWLLL